MNLKHKFPTKLQKTQQTNSIFAMELGANVRHDFKLLQLNGNSNTHRYEKKKRNTKRFFLTIATHRAPQKQLLSKQAIDQD